MRAFASFQSSRGVPMLVKADNMYCGYQRGKFNSLHSCRAISASGSLGRRVGTRQKLLMLNMPYARQDASLNDFDDDDDDEDVTIP